MVGESGTEASAAMRNAKSRHTAARKAAGSIRRTAVYGPVRTVVWEGRSREAPPYPD